MLGHDESCQRRPRVGDVFRSDYGVQLRIDLIDRGTNRRRRGVAALGKCDHEAPTVLRVRCAIEIAAGDQGVYEVPDCLLRDPEIVDDIAERCATAGDGDDDVGAVGRQILATCLKKRPADRSPVGSPGGSQESGKRRVLESRRSSHSYRITWATAIVNIVYYRRPGRALSLRCDLPVR